MDYFYSITDKKGYSHSIDMVYLEYFTVHTKDSILALCRQIHEKYPSLSYFERDDIAPQIKYSYYSTYIAIGGVYVMSGRYWTYVTDNKKFYNWGIFQLRVNPNKHFNDDWFQELLQGLLSVPHDGYLLKYDYAVDVPLPISSVEVFHTRKEKGLYKKTRYYGQGGRHGYLKIYDKGKERLKLGDDVGVLTRIEHTLHHNKIPSLEQVYLLENDSLNTDYSSLNDTDTAIVEMYLMLKAMGKDYDLKLGRRKLDKLKEYILGSYVLLEFEDILQKLIKHLEYVFDINDDMMIITDDNGFLQVPEDYELPFD